MLCGESRWWTMYENCTFTSSLRYRLLLRFIHDTAESDMRHAGVRREAHAGARAVIEAVADAAKKRPAAVRSLGRTLPWIEAGRRAKRVDRQFLAGRHGIRF